MSITLDLPADVEEKLAKLTETERNEFVVIALRRELDDPATLACSPNTPDSRLTPEEASNLLQAKNRPAEMPSEAFQEAIRNWKKLTGRVA